MGLTINYKHRTKNFQRIKELIANLKTFAENNGKYFKVIETDGYSTNTTSEKGKYPKDEVYEYKFFGKYDSYYGNDRQPSKQIFFEIELGYKKNTSKPTNIENVEIFGMGWFKRGEYWICNDWHKVYGPSGNAEETINITIEIISILEYIKNNYFPNLNIDDETDFYIDYNSKSESQKQFWRDILAGKYSNYKGASCKYHNSLGYPDYKKRYLSMKNHDIKNIIASIGDMDNVFGIVDKMLASSGWTKDMIVKNMAIPGQKISGNIVTIENVGDKMVESYIDTIKGTLVQKTRPRVINLNKPKVPINKIRIKRKDGVIQHYYKKIEYKGEKQ